ncbi:hypothetical protein LINPERPRIM_LOCUS14560 [Linum perenne]
MLLLATPERTHGF